MKKEQFVNKEEITQLYKTASEYCASKDLEKLKKIIDEKTQVVNYKNDGNGWSLLMIAAYFDFHVAVEYILKRGGEINNTDLNSGNTALITAVSLGNTRSVSCLMKSGADVNLSNKKGYTPLMSACFNGDPIIVSHLLNFNPEILAKDHEGRTALDFAKDQNRDNIITLIEKFQFERELPSGGKNGNLSKI